MPTQMGHTKKRLMQLQMSGGKGGHLNCFVLIVRAFPRTSCSGCSLGLGCQNVHDCKYMRVHVSGCSLDLGYVRTCTCVHAATDLNVHDGKYTCVHAATDLNVRDG